MKQLAEVLMQYKSYRERQQHLNESLDHLSFSYPNLYKELHRELKLREQESNDPNKITNWLNNSTSNCYVKLHESLILVKGNNILAQDRYLNNLKHMLQQTIENGYYIEEAKKICCLIEKSAHLKTVYESLKHLIQQVNQLNTSSNNVYSLKSIWNDDFKPTQINPFEQFNNYILKPPQHVPVRPHMMQPPSFKSTQALPYFNLDCFGYDHLEVMATVNKNFKSQQSNFNITIIDQGMGEAFTKWLHYLKLHKYQWFFNSLSYLEIECIDEDNIDGFVLKTNINPITNGAQKKICISTRTLRDRPKKFQNMLMALDLEVTNNELCEYMTYMRDILHYPIPNKHCVVGDQLQQDIVLIMEKSLNQMLEKLCASKMLIANSLLGTSINKFLECSLLIIGNQMFMQHQIEKTQILAKTLKYRSLQVPSDFN